MFLILSAAAAEMPVSWCASSTGDAEGFAAEVQAAWDAWEEAAPCAGIADEPVGDCDTVEADVAFVFGDPDEIGRAHV